MAAADTPTVRRVRGSMAGILAVNEQQWCAQFMVRRCLLEWSYSSRVLDGELSQPCAAVTGGQLLYYHTEALCSCRSIID
ncbi:hypothetical protein COCOBI_02-4560 [Coccomyxa sp. Obi]|nr:hypothetical protein COCOBI_02-4560 [Coccomyxa sp. Obi]